MGAGIYGGRLMTSRLDYIDNLRSLMIIFVIMVHAAVTYSGFGMWYYVEKTELDFITTLVFGLFQSFTQAYFMAFLFMIAGYFIPESFDRKGASAFMKDRLFRLGIPTLVYIIILHPIAVKISHPEVNAVKYLLSGITELDAFGWTGPLWFAVALIIFSGFYTIFRIMFKDKVMPKLTEINIITVLKLVVIISVSAFIIRIFLPVGTSIVNMQISYFAAYIVMFVIGIMARRSDLFSLISLSTGKKYFTAAFLAGLPLWGVLMVFGGPLQGDFSINGGLTWQSAVYSIWESFFCVTISIALIGIFRAKSNVKNRIQKIMADNSFGVYVFHPPLLILVSVIFGGVALHPLLKFTAVLLITVPLCFSFSIAVRIIPGMKKIFS